MAIHSIKRPYLLLISDKENPNNAKTAFGLRAWTPEASVGQLRFSDKAVDLGLPEMSPSQAVSAGARTLVIGIAPPGGQLPESWHRTLLDALNADLNIAAGLHQRLGEIAEIAACAPRLGRQIHDVRRSDMTFAVGTGERRSGRRLLTVGTDCALGTKYTALAIAKAMRAKGLNADFRATGRRPPSCWGNSVRWWISTARSFRKLIAPSQFNLPMDSLHAKRRYGAEQYSSPDE
jgi:Domain of unknown function (DUF1611_N) Rossmann-like domain/Domain of unknown function (DUF1611_C) P-loop domain